MKINNKYTVLKNMPKFEEYISNEVFKLIDIETSTLKDRLEMSYKIIKGQDKIYNKMKEKGFFTTFLTVNKSLAFDCNNLEMLINASYKVLHNKEEVRQDYLEIKEEIKRNHEKLINTVKKEIAHTFTQHRNF